MWRNLTEEEKCSKTKKCGVFFIIYKQNVKVCKEVLHRKKEFFLNKSEKNINEQNLEKSLILLETGLKQKTAT